MSEKPFFFGITIDRHVSIGHIGATVAMIFLGSGAYYSILGDIEELHKTDVRHEKMIADTKQDFKAAFDRIDVKLDRIYDRLDRKADK